MIERMLEESRAFGRALCPLAVRPFTSNTLEIKEMKTMEKIARLHVVGAPTRRHALEVSVPYGTTVKGSLRIIERLDAVIEELTGCACMSGLDVHFREQALLEGLEAFQKDFNLPG